MIWNVHTHMSNIYVEIYSPQYSLQRLRSVLPIPTKIMSNSLQLAIFDYADLSYLNFSEDYLTSNINNLFPK